MDVHAVGPFGELCIIGANSLGCGAYMREKHAKARQKFRVNGFKNAGIFKDEFFELYNFL